MRVHLDTGLFDSDQHAVLAPDGGRVRLTPVESKLLTWLAAHPGRPIPHDELLREVWGYSDKVQSRTVYTTVGRLRTKIERDPANPRHLLQETGIGYRFEPGAPLVVAREGFGRHGLIDAISQLVTEGRPVALHGPGGVGKSWLARTLAARLPGASYVDVAGVRERLAFANRVADALGLRGLGGDPIDALGGVFAARGRGTLVIDDVDTCAEVASSVLSTWRARAPGLAVVVTSRRPVPIAEIAVVEVPPLDVTSGVDLFLARAVPSAAAAAGARDDARAIVERLAGLPLAIELAAARTRTLGLRAIARHLDRPLRLLADPTREDARHASLEVALNASYEDLATEAKRLFEDLSVFAGSFDLAAAEAVAGPDATFLPDVLGELLASSLVRVVRLPDDPSEPRYDLLAPVRAFASSRLDARRPVVARRHAAWFARHPWGRDIALRVDRSASAHALAERADAAAAVACAVDQGEAPLAVGALVDVVNLALLASAEAAAQESIALVEALPLGPRERALVAACAANVRAQVGHPGARDACEVAVALCREQGELRALTSTLSVRSNVRTQNGDLAGALEDAEEALTMRRTLDFGIPRGLAVLGVAHHMAGDLPAALRWLSDAVAASNDLGDAASAGTASISRAIVLRHLGRVEDALASYDFAVERLTAARQDRMVALARLNRGVLLRHAGRVDEAIAEFRWCREQAGRSYPTLAAGAAQNLGDALRERQAWDEARRCHEDVLRLTSGLALRNAAYGGLVDVALAESRTEDAARHADAALALVGTPDRDRARALGSAARVAAARGDAAAAVAHLDAGLVLAERVGERALLARLHAERAVGSLELGDRAAAAAHLARAEAALEGVNDVLAAFDVYLARLLLGLAEGDDGTARKALTDLSELGPGVLDGALPGQRKVLADAHARLEARAARS